MTKPISHAATQPSVRQCILAVAILAATGTDYVESPSFNAEMLQIGTGYQASVRESPHWHLSTSNTSTAGSGMTPQRFNVTTQSILFGNNHEQAALDSVEVTKTIRVTEFHAVFEVLWHGQPAVAKCWAPSEFQKFGLTARSLLLEANIVEKRPEGYSFFPSGCVDGVIRCSSLFPYGYILVLTKVKGEPLEKRWATAPAERKEFIYQQVLAAINALRDVIVLWADPGPTMCFTTRMTMSLLCL